MMRRAIEVTFCVVLVIASGIWCSPNLVLWLGLPGFKLNAPEWSSRAGNYHERFYTQIAGSFGDAKMCAKIGHRSIDEEPPSLETKWRVSFQQSECYFDAALRTKDETLCGLVKRVITLPPNASDISPSDCRSLIRKSGKSDLDPIPFLDPSADIMHEMGYRDEDYYELVREKKIAPAPNGGVAWDAFCLYVASSSERKLEFLRRAEALPGFE